MIQFNPYIMKLWMFPAVYKEVADKAYGENGENFHFFQKQLHIGKHFFCLQWSLNFVACCNTSWTQITPWKFRLKTNLTHVFIAISPSRWPKTSKCKMQNTKWIEEAHEKAQCQNQRMKNIQLLIWKIPCLWCWLFPDFSILTWYKIYIFIGPRYRWSDRWVRVSETEWETFFRLNWCDSGWWRYQLNTEGSSHIVSQVSSLSHSLRVFSKCHCLF